MATRDRKGAFLDIIEAIRLVLITNDCNLCMSLQSFPFCVFANRTSCIFAHMDLGPTVESRAACVVELRSPLGLSDHGHVDIVGLDDE